MLIFIYIAKYETRIFLLIVFINHLTYSHRKAIIHYHWNQKQYCHIPADQFNSESTGELGSKTTVKYPKRPVTEASILKLGSASEKADSLGNPALTSALRIGFSKGTECKERKRANHSEVALPW